MSEGKSITIKKDTLWKGLALVFAALFLITIFGGWSGLEINDDDGNDLGGAVQEVQVQIENNDPVYGDANAEVSVVEFSDFQCPFCARAATGFVASLKASSYVANGDVNLIFKHFPLNSIHPYAQKAGEAAECANRQDKFWEYHDLLFLNQAALDITSLKSYAVQVGLNTNDFNSCLDNDEAKSEVIKETAQATSSGGRGTPYTVITKDGEGVGFISGACPYSVFETAIEATLAGDGWYQQPNTCSVIVV